MAEETTGRTGPLDGQLLQHLEWLTTLSPGCLAVFSGPDHVLRYANPAFQALTGNRPLLGRELRQAFPELADQGFYELFDRVCQDLQPVRTEAIPVHFAPASAEQPRYLELWCQPLPDADGAPTGLLVHALDVTGRVVAQQRAEARLQRQASRQEVVARLGQRALAGVPLGSLVEQSLAELAAAVGGEAVTLWQLQPDRSTLLLRRSHGVAPNRDGAERVHVEDENTVSCALRERRPVLVDNCEAVALAPPLSACARARSSVSVLIRQEGAPWGVLSVASSVARRFDTDAAFFVQLVAELLGQALQQEEGTQAPTGAGSPEPGISPAGAAAEPVTPTVLLVEDEPVVRALTAQLLRRGGYVVLEAGHGEEALALAGMQRGRIDLLLTDLIMPRMNGRELAERLQLTQPNVPVLYMSGYTADVISSQGVLQEGIHFLQKPFTATELMSRARDAIHGRLSPPVASDLA